MAPVSIVKSTTIALFIVVVLYREPFARTPVHEEPALFN